MADWGDVPMWIGALGTVLAFFLALAVFSISVRDRLRQQARLVSPLVTGGPVRHSAGFPLPESCVLHEVAVAQEPTTRIVSVAEAVVSVGISIVNHSDEMIAELECHLLSADRAELAPVDLPFKILGPHESRSMRVIYPVASGVGGNMALRLHFTDAVGRRWERVSGQPLRRQRQA